VLLQVIAEQELGTAARLSEAFLAELMPELRSCARRDYRGTPGRKLRAFLAAGGAEPRRS